MNTKLVIPLAVLLFIVESTIMPWIIPESWHGRAAPHFVFVAALYAGLYAGRHEALLFGLGFGLLRDVVFYGHMLGVHTLLMSVFAYLTGLLFERRRCTMLAALAIVGLACFLYDSAAYGIYSLFRVADEPFEFVLVHSVAPSLFLQVGFALAVYVPARKLFEGPAVKAAEEEE